MPKKIKVGRPKKIKPLAEVFVNGSPALMGVVPSEESEVVGVKFEPTIEPVEFADLNTLKDKLNEVIAFITR